MKPKTFFALLTLFVAALVYYFLCNSCSSCHPSQEALYPCPNRPNCVSSQATDPSHAITPLSYKETISPIPKLKKIALTYPKVRVVSQTPIYLHVEFYSKHLSLVDDTEFLWDPSHEVIQIRSASRCGYFDLGTNRARIEKIRSAFEN